MQNFMWALAMVVILGGGYLLWQGSQNTPITPTPSPTPSVQPPSTGSGQAGPTPAPTPTPSVPMTATITYSGTSFSPSEVTVKKGGSVTWKNASGAKMWVASAQHPSHTVYAGTARQEHCPDTAGTAFDQCAGESGDYVFSFQKVGTWNYHDHLNATAFGKVIVVE